MSRILSRNRIVLGAMACGCAMILLACSRSDAPTEPERAVRTLVVAADSAGLTRQYAAEIRPRIESVLSFRVGGKVLRRYVNLGDVVRPGQLLAQLDAQDLKLGQDAAQASLLAARTNRDQSGADYKRFIDLQQQGFISPADLDRRNAAFKAAQAQMEQARAQLEAQTNQVEYASLVADVAGVVTAVSVESGMVVAPGMPVLRVAQQGSRDVVFSVPEDQIESLRAAVAQEGALRVRLWGQDESAPVHLREVSAAADPVTRTFLVKADLGAQDAKIGQTATVLLVLPRHENIVKLPVSAVMEVQGRTVVWVLDPKTMQVHTQPIQVAGADGNDVVVSGGLGLGQEVVTAGVHVLTPGLKVSRYVAPFQAPAAASAAH